MKAYNDGIDIDTQKALKWALSVTGDCLNDSEFNRFLIDDVSFEDIRESRRPKRALRVTS